MVLVLGEVVDRTIVDRGRGVCRCISVRAKVVVVVEEGEEEEGEVETEGGRDGL